MRAKIKEIDKQLKNLKKSDFGREWVIKLLELIEEKIYSIKKEVDIKTFSSLIKELNLNNEQERELSFLRNRIVHSKVDDKELNSKEEWLKYEILPKILSYREEGQTIIIRYDDFTSTVYSKLNELAKGYNYKFQKGLNIKIGKRNYEIDASLQLENEIVLVEITNKVEIDNLTTAKEQLKIYLDASSCKRGIIIKPGIDFEIITDINYKILIFGVENDFSLVNNWISKPEEYKQFNLFLSYSTMDFEKYNIFKIVESLRKLEIGRIYYYEPDTMLNIIEYLEETLAHTDVFILFCSKKALISKSVESEWKMAHNLKLKIITIFKEEEDIPVILRHLLSIKYDENQFEEFNEKLYKEIIRT